MHDRTRFITPETLPDALGGVSLSHLPRHVRLDGPGITAVTVDNAPALEALDLRHCPAGLHLYLSNVPALQRLVLPAQVPGAVVHLAADDTPTLEITGAIDELDACWPGFAFRLADASRAPWDGAEVTATNPTTDSEALILTAAADLTALPPLTGRVRDLFLLGTSGAGASLDLRSAGHLESVQAHGADGIAELCIPTGLHALTLERCTGLERLTGAGRNLQLRACRGDACRVDGVWNHALVDGADFDRLAMPLVERLEVRNAARAFTLEQGEDTAVAIVGRPPRLTGGPRHRCTRNVGAATAGLIARVADDDPEAREQLAWALTRPGRPTGLVRARAGPRRRRRRRRPGAALALPLPRPRRTQWRGAGGCDAGWRLVSQR